MVYGKGRGSSSSMREVATEYAKLLKRICWSKMIHLEYLSSDSKCMASDRKIGQ